MLELDPLNRLKKRNRHNTDISVYNCGGFALGTYSWYEPYDEERQSEIYHMWNEITSIYKVFFSQKRTFTHLQYIYNLLERKLTGIFVTHMLQDFSNLRVIRRAEEAERNERIIIFRISKDNFHYVVSFDHERWWHKMGEWVIEELCEDEVFNTSWDFVYNFHYDGPTVMFAMR